MFIKGQKSQLDGKYQLKQTIIHHNDEWWYIVYRYCIIIVVLHLIHSQADRKCPYYPVIYRFQSTPFNITVTFSTKLEKKTVNHTAYEISCIHVHTHTHTQLSKIILIKKNKAGDAIPPDFKILYKSVIIKTV